MRKIRTVEHASRSVSRKRSAGRADYLLLDEIQEVEAWEKAVNAFRIDLNTVYNYLNALESAFIIYRIPRYDVKGKEILKTLEKYFAGDHSLLYAVMGYRDRLLSGVLENIVMLELKRRGYRVFVGKSDEKEVDFIGELKEKKVYIQVAYKIEGQTPIDREFSPLLDIRDHHPKYVLTMDETWRDNIHGVQHKHIADFLLMKEY